MSACCIKEFTSDVNNYVSAPFHHKTVSVSYNCNLNCLQIFFCRFFYECSNIFRAYNNSHTFLTFRNGKFSTVQTVIFFRNGIKIYIKSRCKFTNSNRNSACTKVVTATDHKAYILIAEQTLDFPLFNCISLLNFGSRSRN